MERLVCWTLMGLRNDRGFDVWMEEFKQIKDKYPDRVLIASIMEEYSKDAWVEIVEKCQEAGADAFELNFSCPHGLPERRMGSAMGENPEILEEVCSVPIYQNLQLWAWKDNLDLGVEVVGALNLSPAITELARFTN